MGILNPKHSFNEAIEGKARVTCTFRSRNTRLSVSK